MAGRPSLARLASMATGVDVLPGGRETARPVPRVSVGLCVYNGENYLEPALDSLLAQTYTDFELIVSDNGSADRTEAICRERAARDHRVRYVRHDVNRGTHWNFAHALGLARGEYFRWAAHDDVCAPEFLERCVEVLDRDPDVILCMPGTVDIDERGDELCEYEWTARSDAPDPVARFRDLVRIRRAFPCFGLVRRAAFEQAPLRLDSLAWDKVLLAELGLYGRVRVLPDKLFLHREHAERAMQAFRNPLARMAHLDPGRGRRVTVPLLQQALEYDRAVRAAPLPAAARRRCHAAIGSWLASRWLRLGAELMMVVVHALRLAARPRRGRQGRRAAT